MTSDDNLTDVLRHIPLSTQQEAPVMDVWLEFISKRVPQTIPKVVINDKAVCGVQPEELITATAGAEARFRQDDNDYAIFVHAVVDRDYEGQWAFMQIAHRPDGETGYGPWRWLFAYRGGDVSWDEWQVDLVFEKYPSYAEFGAYVDDHKVYQ